MNQLKRQKIDDVEVDLASSALYPIKVVTNEEKYKDANFQPLSSEKALRNIPNQDVKWVILRGKTFNIFIEATEKGDDELELLASINRKEEIYVSFLWSPAIYVEGACEYLPVEGFDEKTDWSGLSQTTLDRFGDEKSLELLQDQFSLACTHTLPSFMDNTTYEALLAVFQESPARTLRPPDFCRIGCLSSSGFAKTLQRHLSNQLVFCDPAFLSCLEKITGLELGMPHHQLRVWKLEPGCFMMLNEERGDRLSEGLDVYICLTDYEPVSGDSSGLASIIYIDKDSGDVLVTFKPSPNTAYMAFRSEGASRFVRYIPKSSGMSSPVYYMTITYPIQE